MNLAVSNLAWSEEQETEAFELLKDCGILNVEVVFSKIKPWAELTEDDVWNYKEKLNSYGLSSTSTQSLFYGINADLTNTEVVVKHVERLISYCTILGIKVMVFGSPKMRKGGVANILHKIDLLLNDSNIELLIEPNAKNYGGDYWYDLTEISQFLGNKYRNINTMLDMHNVLLENRDENKDFIDYMDKIKHIHVSEVGLGLLNNFDRHQEFADTLRKFNYQKTISYEVLNADGIFDSIQKFSRIYGDEKNRSSTIS